MACTLCDILNLLVDLLVSGFDIIEIDVVVSRQINGKFWSQSNVEDKFEIILLLDILHRLLFA